MPRIKANFELLFLLRKTQSPLLGFPQAFQVLLLVQPYSKELVLGGRDGQMILAGMSGAVDSPLALKPELPVLPITSWLHCIRLENQICSADEEQAALQLL